MVIKDISMPKSLIFVPERLRYQRKNITLKLLTVMCRENLSKTKGYMVRWQEYTEKSVKGRESQGNIYISKTCLFVIEEDDKNSSHVYITACKYYMPPPKKSVTAIS